MFPAPLVFALALLCAHSTRAQHREHPPRPGAAPAHSDSSPTHPSSSGAFHHSMPAVSGLDHRSMHHDALNPAARFLMGQSSGTGFQPAAWPMPMFMSQAGDWHLMWMGQAYLVATQQTGPRGGDKVYSSNWGMLGAIRRLGRGSLMLRTMLSLDPLTIPGRSYPLLFQTGESAFGRPLVDAQHPHDFVMELSAQYAHPINEKALFNVYYAPVGDVALGPVAFPHRASARWSCRRRRWPTIGRTPPTSPTMC